MASYQQSPGVNVTEIDLTGSITTVGTSIGAYAGNFRWGPVNEIVTISNEGELVSNFGKPDNDTAISFFSAANFLAYTNQLKIARAADLSVAKNATSNSDVSIIISNEINFIQSQSISNENKINAGPFVAKYPGSMGNSLRYSICSANSLFSTWEYSNLFTDAPGTSDHVLIRGGANDEIHLVVIDSGGEFTGVPGTILEKYSNLSRSTLAKDGSGNSIYYQTVINETSKYIKCVADPIRPRPLANISWSSGAYSNAGNVFLTFSGGGVEYIKANVQVFCNSQSNAINQILIYEEGLYSRPPQITSLIAPNGSTSATFSSNLYPQFVSTTWNVRDFSFVRTSSVLGTGSIYGTSVSFRGIDWRPDGSEFYLIEANGDTIRHFRVAEPWNVDSRTQVDYFTLTAANIANTQVLIPVLTPVNLKANNLNGVNANFNVANTGNINPIGFEFGDGGRKVYVLDLTSDYVFQYDMEIPYNLPQLSCKANSFANVFATIGAGVNGGMTFKPDGTQLYIAGDAIDAVHQYTLSTPWQVNTASFIRSSPLLNAAPVTSADLNIIGIKFAANGSLLLVFDEPPSSGTDDKIHMYRLTEAWNVATAVVPPVSNLTIRAADTNNGIFQELYISPDQDRIFALDDTNDTLRQYNLSIGNPNYSSNSTQNYFTTRPYTISLGGGVDSAPTEANVTTAYSYFESAEQTDIGLVITGNHSVAITNSVINSLIETREDCIIFISPKSTDVLTSGGQEAAAIAATRSQINNSSYAFMDSGWKYQYDKYNDVYRWIPLNADIAGICAKTSFDYQDWFSPGGLKRGIVKNIERLAYNPKKNDRDYLYDKQINPVISFENLGFILYGDKTLSRRVGAFDRINVRRLFIVLKKALTNISKYYLFELNDNITRRQLTNIIEPYLRDVQGRRGIIDFRLVCDETNNTPDIVDDNQLVVDIHIKPNKSINYIQLNFIVSRTSVSFREITQD